MIKSHRYDAGWPRDDKDGCIADVEIGGTDTTGEFQPCGEPEDQHEYSEYFPQPISMSEEDYYSGDRHEPPPYPTFGLTFGPDDSGEIH